LWNLLSNQSGKVPKKNIRVVQHGSKGLLRAMIFQIFKVALIFF
jgi:hypothetical protein